MKTIRKCFRVNELTADQLKQMSASGTSENEAVAIAVDFYCRNSSLLEQTQKSYADVLHALELQRKYINELRRSEFVILEILNTICIDKDISAALPHNDAKYQSRTYASAKANCGEHMDRVIKQIKNGNRKLESGEQDNG